MKKKLLTFAVVSFGLLAAVAGVQGVYNAYQTMSAEASESQEASASPKMMQAPQSDGGIWTDSEIEGWEEAQVITNGRIAWNNLCADGDFANYPATKLVNFVVNEWIDGTRVELATSRVTVDPLDADVFAEAVDEGSGFNSLNYCIKVVSRDAPMVAVIDAETGEQKIDPESGDLMFLPQNLDAWDTQFFITFGEDYALKQGDMVRLTMNVKADKAATVSSQLHAAPGAYKHYSAVGDINFTTEWETFEKEFTVDGNGATSYTIALNLAELKEANTYYFDDIDVVISREKALTEDEEMYDQTIPEGWIDLIANGDFEDEGLDNFVAHDYVTFDGEKQEFVAPRVITDPSNEANKCIVVTTDANPKQDYDSQLYITVPEAQHFNEGDVIRLRMRVKADVAQTASSQSHAAPGSYIYYSCLGDVKFQTVWTNFDSGEITVTSSMMQSGSNPGPFRTIALNLSKIKTGNNLYFDDVQLLVMRSNPQESLKTDLAIAIAKAEGASDYLKTEDSYAALVNAVDDGQIILDYEDATEDELQAAINAINDAFAGLTYVEGYTPVTAAMFKHYASVDEPGEGTTTGCTYRLYESGDLPYGDANVSELNWADLSEYCQLIIVTQGDIKPRVLMNRMVAGGQQGATQEDSWMLEINSSNDYTWSTEKYCIENGNVFTIDLAAIVADYGFARLHSIKKQGWAEGVTITDLILSKDKLNPNPNPEELPEASEFVVGNSYYLYNVEAGMYYCGANSWGTQVSVGTDPLPVRFYSYNGSKDTYYLRNYFRDTWMYAFFDSEYTMFVDRNDQADYGWKIVKVGDYYRLQAASEDYNPYYNSTYYPNTYVGLDIYSDDYNTALSPFLEAGEGHYIDWILVDASGVNLPDPEPELSNNWLNLVHNSNCDGDDDRSIIGRDGENYSGGELFSTRFEEGVGVEGSRGVVVSSIDNASAAWDTQFFITTNHVFKTGESFKLSFDYRSDSYATVSTETHAAPATFIYWGCIGNLYFEPYWQHYEEIVEVSSDMDGMQTICFDLNKDLNLATNFYFDNIELCVNEIFATEADVAEAAEILVEEPIINNEGKIPYLTNGNFNSDFNDWKWDSNTNSPSLSYGIVEFYETNFDFYRKFSNVKEGLYMLEAQAFYRTGEVLTAWNERETATVYTKLYANDNQIPVKNIMSESLPYERSCEYSYYGNWFDVVHLATYSHYDDSQYVPDQMSSASVAFEQGCYNNQVFTYVNDKTLRIGIKCVGATANGRWTAFDNFKLTYISEEQLHIMADNLVAAAEGTMSAATSATIQEIAAKKDTASYRTLATLYSSLSLYAINAEIAAYQSLKSVLDLVEARMAASTVSPTVVAEVSPVLAAAKDGYEAGQFTEEDAKAQTALLNEYAVRLGYTHLDINVAVPGSMGDSILAYVENFSDVQSLRLTGKLDDTDIATLSRLSSLVEVDLEDLDWTSIPYGQFRDRTNLQRVKFPKNLVSIGENVFYGCTNLQYINLPGSLQTIGDYAFYNCYNLHSFDFPSTLQSIGYDAFYNTKKFDNVVLPEGLTFIGGYAFSNSGLSSVTFPSTLKTIGYDSFNNCDNLTDIHFNGQTSIESEAFYSCNALESVKFPETMQTIDNRAFSYCYNLKNVEFNEGLTTINSYAFGNCDALESVTLPSSLLNIRYAFQDCDILQEITCLAVVPPFVDNNNIINYSGRDLYVPYLSVNVYKQAAGWYDFNIHGINSMPETIVVRSDYKLNWPDSLTVDYKPNITITDRENIEYGSLSVNGRSTLSAGQFTMKYDPNIVLQNGYNWNGESYEYNRFAYTSLINNSSARADNVTIELWTRSNNWDFLSFPFDVKVGDIRKAFDEFPFVIRKYDGQKRADGLTDETWVNMTDEDVLEAGQGYIWQSASTETGYQGFYLDAMQTVNKNNIFTNDDVEVELANYESEFAHNRSWNLIGNPYPCFYDIRAMQTSAPIIVWDSYNRNYRAYAPGDDSYILNPGQAFFVQRPVDESSITFLKEGRQNNLTVRDISYDNNNVRARVPKADRSVFNLKLSGEEMGDQTRFVINSTAKMDYESGRDAGKFMSLESAAAQLYTINNGVRYAINERPMDDGIVLLGLQIGTSGLYTISLDTKADIDVVLFDNETGEQIHLNGTDGYTFRADKGVCEGRFVIAVGGDVTSIKSISSDMIANGAKYFDLTGRPVQTPTRGLYIDNNGKKVMIK